MRTLVILSLLMVNSIVLAEMSAVQIQSPCYNNGPISLDEKTVVWSERLNSRNNDIKWRNFELNQTGTISNDAGKQMYPSISNGLVAWVDYGIDSSGDIKAANFGTSSFSICGESGVVQFDVVVNQDRLVWSDYHNGNYDIAFCEIIDGSAGPREWICTDLSNQTKPDIDGNYIVWQDYRNQNDDSNVDIYCYDILSDTTFAVCENTSSQLNPVVSGDYIVWQDSRDGDVNIYGYQISSSREFLVCNAPEGQITPQIEGKWVVWKDSRENKNQVYCYNLETHTEHKVFTTSSSQDYPAVSDQAIVWYESNCLMAAELPGEPVITITAPASGELLPSGGSTNINWTSTGAGNELLKIEYSTDHGQSWNVIAEDAQNDGSCSWTKPSVSSDECIVRITNTSDETGFDIAVTGLFSIVSCDPSLTADINGDCIVDADDLAILSDQWLQNGLQE